MGAVRRISVVPWGRPAPMTVSPPSWIGKQITAPSPVAPVEPPPRVSMPPASSAAQHRLSTPPFRRPSGSLAAVTTSAREIELEGHVSVLRTEIAALEAELAHAKTRILTESEPEIVRLAVAVAKRVVGRELSVDPQLVVAFVTEGIRALPGQADPVIAVAPDVAPLLIREEGWNVLVDRSLASGAIEVREGNAAVAVDADARLASLADALGVDGESP